MTSRWRHNGHGGVSNHQPHNCLLNRLVRRRSKTTSMLRVSGLCVRGIHRWLVNSPHKWPVCGKCFHLMTSSWVGWTHRTMGKVWPKRTKELVFWCAILIAHQLLWQNMEAPVSIFQESPLAGEPRQRLFHIHSVNHYQLRTKYLYPSTLLWQINGCNF